MKKEFAKYVSLNIAGMLGISFYILADTLFISESVGADGITALNFALAVYSIMHGLGLMTGIGGAARYSILKSLGRKEEAGKIFMNSLYIGSAAALLLMTAGAFFSGEISSLLGADSQTAPHTEVYICTMLCFSPCFILNNIMISFIRNDGSPGICMAAMLVSSTANIILDYIFMFPLSMGMYGAVFATGLSPIISLSILCIHLAGKRNTISLCRCSISPGRILSLTKLGISSFITELSSAVTLTVFNLLLIKIGGNIAVAAYGIIANTALVANSVFSGISQGIQPIASREYGNPGASRRIVRYSLITSAAISVFIFALVYIFSGEIASAFNSENNLILGKLAERGLKLYFAGFLFAGINNVFSQFFSAVDCARRAMLISVLRSTVLIIPAVLLMSRLWETDGVWLSFTVTEFLTFIVSLIGIVSYIKKQKLQ